MIIARSVVTLGGRTVSRARERMWWRLQRTRWRYLKAGTGIRAGGDRSASGRVQGGATFRRGAWIEQGVAQECHECCSSDMENWASRSLGRPSLQTKMRSIRIWLSAQLAPIRPRAHPVLLVASLSGHGVGLSFVVLRALRLLD